jgi:hypothetical protein
MIRTSAVVALVVLAGCAREPWPEPPAVAEAQYRTEYEMWRQQQQQSADFSLQIAGIWPVNQGDTPFAGGAGVLTRAGDTVTVSPAPRTALAALAALTFAGGGPVPPKTELALYETTLAVGTLRYQLTDMGEESPKRLFLMAVDQARQGQAAPIAVYPVDQRWRVAARFDAFATPKPVTVADVRGGTMTFDAVGELAFRRGDAEYTLTAFGEPGSPQFFVMFKDATNQSTTYAGYRIVAPPAVKTGEWTVIDFNLASNPPCAYSKFTTCPLPPPENRLDAMVEAGEKRHQAAEGWAG